MKVCLNQSSGDCGDLVEEDCEILGEEIHAWKVRQLKVIENNVFRVIKSKDTFTVVNFTFSTTSFHQDCFQEVTDKISCLGDLVILESVFELEYFQFDNNPPGTCRLFRRSDRECRGMSGPRGNLVETCLSGAPNITFSESIEDKSEAAGDADRDSQFQERQSVKSWRNLFNMNE